MNLTPEQFVSGFEGSTEKLPEVLETWDDIDSDLQEEYIEQFSWVLEHLSEISGVVFSERLNIAYYKILPLRDIIWAKMGIEIADSA